MYFKKNIMSENVLIKTKVSNALNVDYLEKISIVIQQIYSSEIHIVWSPTEYPL